MSSTTHFDENRPPYASFIFRFRWAILCFGLVTTVISIIFGIRALSDFDSGGLSVPGGEALSTERRIGNYLVYPEYAVIIQLSAPHTTLTVDDNAFKIASSNIKTALTANKIKLIISYADFPEQEKLVSNDRTKTLIVGTAKSADINNENLRSAVAQAVSGLPIKAVVSGAAVVSNDINTLLFEGLEKAEITTIPFVIVILFITSGSIVAGLTPWVVCISTICWALGILVGIHTSFNLANTAVTVVTMFGVGLGIDYSLFVLTRYQIERSSDPFAHGIIILDRVIQTASRTITFSAITVFLSLLGALAFHQFALVSLCLSVMIVAVCTCFSANTLLLSLLAILDTKIFKGNYNDLKRVFGSCGNTTKKITNNHSNTNNMQSIIPQSESNLSYDDQPDVTLSPTHSGKHTSEAETTGFFYTIGSHVTKNPWPHFIWSLGFLITFIVICLMKIKFGSVGPRDLPNTLSARQLYDDLETQFDKYGRSRIYIYLETASNQVTSVSFLNKLSVFTNELRQIEGVTNVIDMLRPGDYPYTESEWIQLYSSPTTSNYTNILLPLRTSLAITDLNHVTYVTVSLKYQDFSSHAKHTVPLIRDILSRSFKDTQGRSLLVASGVGGIPAAILDLYKDILETLPIWIVIMLSMIFLLLLVMTGSLIIPIKAVLFATASLGANLGLLTLIFAADGPYQDVGSSGYFDGTNIIFISALTFSLSVDYEIFIIAQIQEIYYEIGDTREAIARALQRSGRLITSAALMFALVTAAFLASELIFIKYIGLGIAMAVLLDATVVRMVLVPATMAILGDWCWYCPGPIKRVVDYLGLQESKPTNNISRKGTKPVIQP